MEIAKSKAGCDISDQMGLGAPRLLSSEEDLVDEHVKQPAIEFCLLYFDFFGPLVCYEDLQDGLVEDVVLQWVDFAATAAEVYHLQHLLITSPKKLPGDILALFRRPFDPPFCLEVPNTG
jgi:hypothetical protein